MKEVRAEILSLSLINFEPNIFTHILAIQGLIPTQFLPQGEYAFLGQAWSISLEWQFYIIAPFITLFIMQYWKSLIALSVLLFVLIVIKVTSTIMPNGFIGNHALLFFLGAATHYLFLLHIRHNTSIHDANKKMLLLVIFLILIETPNVIPILIWIVVNAGIINSTGLKKTLISSILTHKVCKWLGIRSYSIYLSHMIPLTICVAVMTSFEIHNPIVHASMLLFTTLIGTIAFSYSTYRWIEAPFQKLGKKLTSQRR